MPTYVSTHGGVWIGRRLIAHGEPFDCTAEEAASLPNVVPVAPKTEASPESKGAPVTPVVPSTFKKGKAP